MPMQKLWDREHIAVFHDEDAHELVIRIPMEHAETARPGIKEAVNWSLSRIVGHTGNDRYLVYAAIKNAPWHQSSRSEILKKLQGRNICSAYLSDYLRSLIEADKIGVRYDKPARGRTKEIYYIKGDL